ncbi:hypothetical protein QVA66_06600 [Staphylococcus chromogenes]|nr:hypothetical protein [Staphylococcus chromogenes]
MDRLEVNKEVFRKQVAEIEDFSKTAEQLHVFGGIETISASYSQVSGLDQLGEYHGAVVEGGVGSAVATLQKYAQQVSWLRDGLLATEQALTGQENLVDRAVQIADQGGHVGEELSLFPERPDQNFEDFDFPMPVVRMPSSLSELSSAFASTDSGAVGATADSWRSMAKNAHQLAENIRMTAWDMDEINKAKAIEGAVQRALEIADAADRFSTNAQAMAGSVEAMGAVEKASSIQVSLAELSIAFIQDPAEREAAEQAFLANFMGATFPSAVAAVVPTIRNLMEINPGGTGGGTLRAGMSDVAGKGGLPIIEEIEAGSERLRQLIDDPRNISSADFGAINPHAQLPGAGGAGAPGLTLDEAAIGTQAAQLANALPDNVGSAGMPGLSGLGAGGTGLGTPQMVNSLGGPLNGRGASSGASNGAGFGGLPPHLMNTNPAQGARHAAGFGGDNPAGQPGFSTANGGRRNSDRNASHAAAGLAGAGIGAGAGAMGALGALGAGAPNAGLGGFVPTAGGLPATVASTSGTGRGVAPFGGMPMAGAMGGDNKRAKVKTVTSAIEAEGNMKSLLGDLPPVVPGAIGAWARN